MRLPKIVLASTAALALSVSLGACSFSVDGSGSGDSASSAASQAEQKDEGKTTSADSSDSARTDSKSSAKSGSQSSSNGSATGSADSDDGKDGDDAPITDATWKDIQSKGERTEVSGTYAVQGSGSTLNLVGDLDTLAVQGSDVKIAAEDVNTLTIQGSDVTVYARDIDHLTIMGSGVTVHWLGDDPTIQDTGAGNTTGKLAQ